MYSRFEAKIQCFPRCLFSHACVICGSVLWERLAFEVCFVFLFCGICVKRHLILSTPNSPIFSVFPSSSTAFFPLCLGTLPLSSLFLFLSFPLLLPSSLPFIAVFLFPIFILISLPVPLFLSRSCSFSMQLEALKQKNCEYHQELSLSQEKLSAESQRIGSLSREMWVHPRCTEHCTQRYKLAHILMSLFTYFWNDFKPRASCFKWDHRQFTAEWVYCACCLYLAMKERMDICVHESNGHIGDSSEDLKQLLCDCNLVGWCINVSKWVSEWAMLCHVRISVVCVTQCSAWVTAWMWCHQHCSRL